MSRSDEVVHGWPHVRPRMATRSSTDGHTVVHGWKKGGPHREDPTGRNPQGTPQGQPGHLRMARSGRLRMARGRQWMARGRPRPRMARALPSSCPRMPGEPDRKQESSDIPLFIKMGARAARSSRWHIGGRQRMAQPVHIQAVSCREFTGTTALKAWSATKSAQSDVCHGTRCGARDSSTHRYLRSSSHNNNSDVNSVPIATVLLACCAEARGDPTGVDVGQIC